MHEYNTQQLTRGMAACMAAGAPVHARVQHQAAHTGHGAADQAGGSGAHAPFCALHPVT